MTTRTTGPAKADRSTRDLTRLSVNMNRETAQALEEIADEKDISYTEAIRRAVAIFKYIQESTDEGKAIQIVDPETKQVRELVLLG